MERSLFFSQRSGSGGGVTPGITPAGTRDDRTFFNLSAGVVGGCGCCAEGAGAVGIEDAGAGGGAVSIALVIEAGKASIARR